MIRKRARKLLDELDAVWMAEKFDTTKHWDLVRELRAELQATARGFTSRNLMADDEKRERLLITSYVDRKCWALRAAERMRSNLTQGGVVGATRIKRQRVPATELVGRVAPRQNCADK